MSLVATEVAEGLTSESHESSSLISLLEKLPFDRQHAWILTVVYGGLRRRTPRS